ncbi:YbhB/YbcL family Raf kinase inhibitor-like protein [Duganella violaceipulchra]|uniref:Raf kinase inhibitor-like YbhB/YbcL family protein n=1 Tax=Duganella violaceipulchra TaxID=2849652 RepID=A0AA41HH98_9BURK|nr:YbhB/YbcL family Raf kinase inhibitor-like protein [Duganella violaceicalia]MBV6324126.1 YbhB/YbcL family Raf kinase inhibitor-like protein [Duganella violaceicalia]MCP2011941.1 Raf kinase inhibitor-like YbhB/YbcL family protein [Duganella violaceicalia]
MKLSSDSFRDGGVIPSEYAFGKLDADGQVVLSANRNPHLAWRDVPAGTESLALLCIDGDAPQGASYVNGAGCPLPESQPRGDFFHWSLVDIPVGLQAIADGALARGVTARGKPGPDVVLDGLTLRQGVNDYSGWFSADPAMAGDYYGYDGPCPPFNDERLHHYIFRLYALDTPRLELEGRFSCADLLNALHGHIIDEAQLIGTYTLNPALAAQARRSRIKIA